MPLAPADLATRLLAWYAVNGRDLPWRETRDPYAILVSEVMLQQTQVDRVIPRWHAWLERWPSVDALAAAPVADVIAAWSGLGYNRRAVNLHRAACAVAADGWPADLAGLRRLPGVGPYTAAALGAQAFGWDVIPVDVNVERVLGRALGASSLEPPPGLAHDLTQALFDLGATVCLARVPRCLVCPLADGCPSAGLRFEPQRKQGPFEGSRRQARGRLLEALRAGPVALSDPLAVPDIVSALVADGLAEVGSGHVRLPGA